MIPILYVGAPGIGKTAKVRARYDYCEVLLLSSCCEEDIAGLPYREGNKERRTLPNFVERINAIPTDKTVCLFLDEIDKARREVADTLLTLVTNPKHFGITREIDIVAAANPPEWGGGDGLSKAMQSRFTIIQDSFDISEWEKWARATYKDYRISKIIDMIMKKEIPILESVGENYDFRLTCPRTIELAWKALLADKKELVGGLVTKNCESGMIMAFYSSDKDKKEDKAQLKARRIGAKAQHTIFNAPISTW